MKEELILIKKLMQKKGYQFTTQKKIILEELFKSNIHLNVKQIYEKVKDRNIGIATIYRAMKLFSKIGIVKEINIDGMSYYELKIYSKKPLHIHLQCMQCNNIIDVDNNKIIMDYLKINKEIEKDKDFEIFDSNIVLRGLCKKCKNNIDKIKK